MLTERMILYMTQKEFMSGSELRQYLHISTRKMKYLMDNNYIPHENTPLGAKFGTVIISRSMRLSYGLSENMVIVFSPCEIEKALRFLCNRRAIDSITYSVAGVTPVQRSAARLRGRDMHL